MPQTSAFSASLWGDILHREQMVENFDGATKKRNMFFTRVNSRSVSASMFTRDFMYICGWFEAFMKFVKEDKWWFELKSDLSGR